MKFPDKYPVLSADRWEGFIKAPFEPADRIPHVFFSGPFQDVSGCSIFSFFVALKHRDSRGETFSCCSSSYFSDHQRAASSDPVISERWFDQRVLELERAVEDHEAHIGQPVMYVEGEFVQP